MKKLTAKNVLKFIDKEICHSDIKIHSILLKGNKLYLSSFNADTVTDITISIEKKPL